jgi:cyclophilin family peptidyl-prolyl cis-trans isomerase
MLGPLGLCAALALAACGGGSGGGSDPNWPQVEAITATPVWYGEPAAIRVSGERLDSNLKLRASGACQGEPTITLRTSTRLEARCTPTALGVLRIEAQSAGGAVLSAEEWTIAPPIVAMDIGSADDPTPVRVQIDIGSSGSVQRAWSDLFLYRLREGHYAGTVFHQILRGVRIEGGCYEVGTSSAVPQPRSWPAVEGDAPPQQTIAPNARLTLAMSSTRCRADDGRQQAGIFAINLADNSAQSLTSVDDDQYVVIGQLLSDPNPASLQAVSEQTTGRVADWLTDFPADPDAATLRRIERIQ